MEGTRLLEAVLIEIQHELDNEMGDENDWQSPFLNSGNIEGFSCPVFSVRAYWWRWFEEHDCEKEPIPWNFKWRDVEIRWYKHCRRGLEVNRDMTAVEIEQMLIECVDAIWEYGKEKEQQELAAEGQ